MGTEKITYNMDWQRFQLRPWDLHCSKQVAIQLNQEIPARYRFRAQYCNISFHYKKNTNYLSKCLKIGSRMQDHHNRSESSFILRKNKFICREYQMLGLRTFQDN